MDRNQHYRTGKERRTPPPARMYDQDRNGPPPRKKSGMKQVVLPLGSIQNPPGEDRNARRASPGQQARQRAAAQKRRITKGEMRRRRRRLKALTTLMVLVMVAAGTLFGVNVLFKVSTFRVENLDGSRPADTGIYTEEEILGALGVKAGESIFGFSASEKAAAVGAALPQLETVTVKRSLPSTLVVRVQPAVDTFCLETEAGWAVLSQNRKVLRVEGEKPSGLIQLEGLPVSQAQPGYALALTPPEEGQDDPAQVLEEILGYLDRESLTEKTTSIQMEDLQNLSFWYDDRIQVELGTPNSLDYKMQLAGYLLRNENGDALSGSDEGTLNCSHITQQGEIRPVFSPKDAQPTPTPEDGAADQSGEGGQEAGGTDLTGEG